MAITIKELNVTLHIGDSISGSTPEENQAVPVQNSHSESSENYDKMVEDTVKEVLRILKEQNER